MVHARVVLHVDADAFFWYDSIIPTMQKPSVASKRPQMLGFLRIVARCSVLLMAHCIPTLYSGLRAAKSRRTVIRLSVAYQLLCSSTRTS